MRRSVEAVSVAVSVWMTEGLCGESCQLAHSHTFAHISPHNMWDMMAFYGRRGTIQGMSIAELDTKLIKLRPLGRLWNSKVAERAGFEPARSLRPYAISSRARSSTPAPLRARTIEFIIGSALLHRKFNLPAYMWLIAANRERAALRPSSWRCWDLVRAGLSVANPANRGL